MKSITNFKQRNLLSGHLLLWIGVIFLISVCMSLTSCTGDLVNPDNKLNKGEVALKSVINGSLLIQKFEFMYSTVDKMGGINPPTATYPKNCPEAKVYVDRFNTFMRTVQYDNYTITKIGEIDCPK